MSRSNKKVVLIFIVSLLSIVILPVLAGAEWKRAYTNSEGDRYYYYSKSVSVARSGGDGINYFVEMRVYPSLGSKEYNEIKDIVKNNKYELAPEDVWKDYLYKEIQADIDCNKNKIMFKHTDYIAVGDIGIWSDIYEPEKWQSIDSDSMKAIKEAVCR